MIAALRFFSFLLLCLFVQWITNKRNCRNFLIIVFWRETLFLFSLQCIIIVLHSRGVFHSAVQCVCSFHDSSTCVCSVRSFIQSVIHSFIHPVSHSFIHPVSHPVIHSVSHFTGVCDGVRRCVLTVKVLMYQLSPPPTHPHSQVLPRIIHTSY